MRNVILFIALLHGLALAADLLAPYDVAEQKRLLSFAPPTRVHVVDTDGRLQGPFVYALRKDLADRRRYVEDTSVRYPILFWTKAEKRSIGPFDIEHRLFGTESPSGIHLWGTDRYGRDMFSRTLHGARLSLFAGALAGTLAVVLGLLLGATSALLGGWVDVLLMRAAEMTLSLPWLYLLIGSRAFLPLRLDPVLVFVLTIALVGTLAWALPARLVRGVVLAAKAQDYVQAARGFGATRSHLLFRHLLPQTRDTLVTQWAILVPKCVMAEVTLSFFGLGVQEPVPSLGSLLAVLTEAHGAMARWWMFSPAVALGLAILSYHLLAEALQQRREV